MQSPSTKKSAKSTVDGSQSNESVITKKLAKSTVDGSQSGESVITKKSVKSTAGGSQLDESVIIESLITRTPSQKNKRESGEFNSTIDNESVTEDNNVTNGKRTRKKKIDPAYDYYN